MANISDRSLFLEAAKTNAMTVSQIAETFNVALNTARVWVKHPEIEVVDTSWPPAYRRKDSFASEMPTESAPVKTKSNEFVHKFPRPPKDIVESLFGQVMDGTAPIFNFTEEFQQADSQKNLATIRHHLSVGLTLVEYYESIMKQEGMD